MMTLIQVALYIAIVVIGMVAFGLPFIKMVVLATLIIAAIFGILFWQRKKEWENEVPEAERAARDNNANYWQAITGRFPSNNLVWCGWVVAAMLSSIIAITHPGPSAIDYLTAPQSPRVKAITQKTDREIAALKHLAETGRFQNSSDEVSTEDEAEEPGDWRWWPMSAYLWFTVLVLVFPTFGDEARAAWNRALDKAHGHFGGEVRITGPGATLASGILRRRPRPTPTPTATTPTPATPPTTAEAATTATTSTASSAVDRAIESITTSTFLQHVLANFVTELPEIMSGWLRKKVRA